jgi:hypothetical protein
MCFKVTANAPDGIPESPAAVVFIGTRELEVTAMSLLQFPAGSAGRLVPMPVR